ncbi:unnamed protein product [Gongylonema pulchrum]|uniref:Secreted protein n=1 Tax=Gongylonema pulchrum TaxID=637853 RepID=A0A183EEY4_9BILA|nr:unnamed protein product [Gongylonema pulchrum]
MCPPTVPGQLSILQSTDMATWDFVSIASTIIAKLKISLQDAVGCHGGTFLDLHNTAFLECLDDAFRDHHGGTFYESPKWYAFGLPR